MKLRSVHQCSPPVPKRANRWRCIRILLCGKKLNCCLDGDQRERDLFRAYIRINGVGPKMALALISSISLPTLVSAVQANEVGVLTKVPGWAKKPPSA